MGKEKTLKLFLCLSVVIGGTLMMRPVLAEEAAPPGGAPQAAAPQAAAAQPPEPKPDPAGISTGDKSTVIDAGGNSFVVSEPTDKAAPDYGKKKKDFDEYQAQAAKEPLAAKLADAVGHVRIATNFSWTLLTGYLVLFMQAGFALLTCGLVRKKNAAHLMMLNFAAYVFAFLAYYAVGFAFQFGAVAVNAAPTNLGGTPTLNQFLIGSGQWGFLGGKSFFLSGAGYDAGSNALTLFEVVFMETAGYIIVGAICERITFWSFVLCELFLGAILYPMFGCWVWGGGWLSQLGATMNFGHGYVDFAGSTVVHAVGGFCAMALAVILGPRLGKYGPDGKPNPFPAHNIAFVVIGTFILLFGWMGFNPGSTLGSTDLRISVIAVNTNLAAVAASATAMILGTASSANQISQWPATECSLVSSRLLRLVRLLDRTPLLSSVFLPASSFAWASSLMSECLRSTTPVAPSPCTGTAAGSARSVSVSLPMALTAPAGTALVPRPTLERRVWV